MRRGDTVVEVILAFAVFAILAVTTTVTMNRSLSQGQRSLEITLVRQQIDAQAELLRHARDTDSPVWQSITDNLAANSGTSRFDVCPASGELSSSSFVLSVDATNGVEKHSTGPAGVYTPAGYYSQVINDGGIRAQGMWITPMAVDDSASGAYDMYIRACWNSVGSNRPMYISTIVRLYET